jgi:eukaryotic-like serine/threonine-protein kinase
MLHPTNCPACSSVLPPDAPGGLCPTCLLRQGLACDGSRPSGNGSEGAFERGEFSAQSDSISRFGSIARPLLREARLAELPRHVNGPASTEMPAPVHRGDRYQILGEIARGGMGVVLKGRDHDLGRDLAIKVLLEKHRDQPELIRRFIEEAQIGGQLQHPGVVPVYELGQFGDDRPYFAMKLVEGCTLAALLAARQAIAQDLPRLLDIFEQICQTIAYAHARGVIHRDLKPSNVMVGHFGEIQVMDWGLAKVLPQGGLADDPPAHPVRESAPIGTARNGSDAAISRAGSVLGTPAYMAPEQARGDLERVDERVDVFGLGAILCEILTGRPPYVGADSGDIQRLAARAELGDAFERLGACGAEPELVDLSRRCLAAQPDDRPRDAGIVASGMTGYLRGMQERLRQAELRRVEAQARASEERTRRRLAVGLATAVVGLVVTAGGGGAWSLHQHHVRAARVDPVIREAEWLAAQAETAGDDLARWLTAREAVRRALAVAHDARDAATRDRVAMLSERVGKQSGAAESDARLLDRLDEVREAIDDIAPAQTEAAYATEFRAAGLVPDTRTPEELGRAIARRPPRTAVALAVALDHWAALRFEQGDRASARRITAVARAADPDEYRGRLRTALMEPSAQVRRAALGDLARSAQTAELPPVTAALLGAGLLHVGDPVAAESVLRSAQRRNPADPWLAQVLARALEKQSRTEEAIRYYFIARAARPESTHALAHALERNGESTEAIAVFREAIRLNPSSARHLHCLAKALEARGQVHEAEEAITAAIAAGREALKRAPDASLHHLLLNIALHRPGRLDDVIAAYRTAIRIRPDDASTRLHLGTILAFRGRADEAIAEFREAIRLEPDLAEAHAGLGMVLSNHKHDHAGAVSAYRELIRLRADDPMAHYNLAIDLNNQGHIDEAIAEYREAIRLKPEFGQAYGNLGALLCRSKSDQDEGRAALREAIRLEPREVSPHYNLADSLERAGRFDEAMAEYRDTIRLEPRLAKAHFDLGRILSHSGLNGEAMAEYQTAIRLKPEFAEAHCNLAFLLRDQGQFTRSLIEFEVGHELGSLRRGWSYPSKQWLERARRLARLAMKFSELPRGEARPDDVVERLDLGLVAYGKGAYAMSASLFAGAFAADPRLAEDLEAHHRYNAACSAALAGGGKGNDQPPPDEAARIKLRRQALDWLGGELAAWSRIAASGSPQDRPAYRHNLLEHLEHWKRDPDLAGVREAVALKELDPAEQAGWRALWAEVDRVLARARAASD